MNILRIKMIDVNILLKELDDALDKVVAKKEPESFLKPIVSRIEDYQKSIRQIQAQFTDAPKFNEEGAYPKFLSCGLKRRAVFERNVHALTLQHAFSAIGSDLD